jgi:PST family polysaccharide transporter
VGLLAGAGLAVLNEPLVRLAFGAAFGPAAAVVVILSWLAPLIAVSNVLGLQWMLPNRMERALNAALAGGAAAGLGLALVLAPRFGAAGMAWSVVGAESVVVCGVILSLVRANELPWVSKEEELASC